MRVALYARVSTRDKDQNPETQVMYLRDFVIVHTDWLITNEDVDIASANVFRRSSRRMEGAQ